jgi:hypothetical protein
MEIGEWVNHKNNHSQLLTGVCKREKEGCPLLSIGMSTPHANRYTTRGIRYAKWQQREDIVMPTPPKTKWSVDEKYTLLEGVELGLDARDR